MGVINAENMLKFKSSQQLFDRIKKRLSSFDAQDMIDDGDFHKHVMYILEQLGQAVYKECEAMLFVKNNKTILPNNFKILHAAFKCSSGKNAIHAVPSINEQKPLIFYQDTEITKECPPNKCNIRCTIEDKSKTKIVIRTFVNGESTDCSFNNPTLLTLSPNVRDKCTDDSPNIFATHKNEITIDDDGFIHTVFETGSIFLQYYGHPIDENGLPMIPVNEDIEKAVEYYILTQLFEDFYLNSTVPNVGTTLSYLKGEFENKYLPQAKYWAKLPSFKRMVNAIRRARSRNKFLNFYSDRTIVR